MSASADGDVDDLATLVAARLKPPARLLYLAGEERSGDLAGVLRAKNFAVDTVRGLSRRRRAKRFPAEAAAALRGGIDGVLHFSRRSAEAFVAAARNAGLLEAALSKPVHFCLSARVAEPLREAGAADVRIAAQPDEAALLVVMRLNQRDYADLLGFIAHVAAAAAPYYAVLGDWLGAFDFQ